MALFKTIEEFRKYVTVDQNMNFENLLPHIREAEELFVKELLGDLYPVLLTDYTEHTDAEGVNLAPPNNMNADNLLLLPYVQRAIAYYASLLALDTMGSSLGDMGIQEMRGQNSSPAPRWKVRQLEQKFSAQADRFADKLLEFLEENASVTKYNSWYSDMKANTAMAGYIVYSTTIASKYIDINDSRRIFLRMKKRSEEIEKQEVKRMICTDQYEELVVQIKTGSLTAHNTALTLQLEEYITKFSLLKTLPYIRVSITDDGLVMHSTSDGVVGKATATDPAVKDLIKSLEKDIKEAKEKIDQFIIDNIANYPLIQASPCYTSKELTPPKYQSDNSIYNKHFSI